MASTTTSSVPRIALKRVRTLARTIPATVRFVEPLVTLTSPWARRSATSASVRPVGAAAGTTSTESVTSAAQVLGEPGGLPGSQGHGDPHALQVLLQGLLGLGHGVVGQERLDPGGQVGVAGRADPVEHAHDAVRREPLVHLVPAALDQVP